MPHDSKQPSSSIKKLLKVLPFTLKKKQAEQAAAEEALNKIEGGHKAAVLVSSNMFKNRLQEKAQKRRLNFPSYSSTRKGPDHAPQFKATVNFNGKTYKSPTFYPTVRRAENAAAEVALNTVEKRGHNLALAAVLAVVFLFLHAWLKREQTALPPFSSAAGVNVFGAFQQENNRFCCSVNQCYRLYRVVCTRDK